MNRKTLASLSLKGGLTAIFEASENKESRAERTEFLEDLASSLSGEKPYLILDFTENLVPSSAPCDLDKFFTEEELHIDSEGSGFSRKINANSSLDQIEANEENIRIFLKKMIFTRKTFPEILLVFNKETALKFQKILYACNVILFNATSQEAADEFADIPLNFKKIDSVKIWYSNLRIPAKIKLLFTESSKYLPSQKKGKMSIKKLAVQIHKLREIAILQKNKPEGFIFSLSRLWLLWALILLAIPLSIPFTVSSHTTKLRDMVLDRNTLSEAPYFEYEFDGTESLRRIARYSIGRFHSKVTDQKMISTYIGETLSKNNFDGELTKNGDDYIPAAGTTLRFYPMDSLGQASDSVSMAWQYFTSMLSDSVSYITELYHKTETKNQRKHTGIDLAGKRDARILAPFAAKAWTFEDERGGVILGLVQNQAVILFMHCDKLLYLDGQNVMAGDPVATVGVTGHTTGPHAHIVTGIVNPDGEKTLGGIHYNIVDPVVWYSKFFRAK